MEAIIGVIAAIVAAVGAYALFPSFSKKKRSHRDDDYGYGRSDSQASTKLGWGMNTSSALLLSGVSFAALWFVAPFALNVAFAANAVVIVMALLVPMLGWYLVAAYMFDRANNTPDMRTLRVLVSALLAVLSLVSVVAMLSGSELLHSASYQALLGKPVNEGVKLPSLKLDSAPLVSRDMALQEAQKLLSQDPGLGSQVSIPRMYKQLVNGKLVWVGFMEPSSFSRWLANGTTPGYAVVSATDPADAKLVTGLKMKYLADASFLDNIELHTQMVLPTAALTDFSEEIDDAGKPYWVITKVKPAVGTEGKTTAGTVLVDPVTGAVKVYSVAKTPKWVDRIQPRFIVQDQINAWGEYIHGYWNSVFSGNGTLATSAKPQLLYGDNGHAYWYVGLTSTGSDNGIVGFMLVDSRTKKAYRYQLAGANEDVAMQAVEGLVRANRYSATQPVVFEVEGVPTYVMTLTDGTGIIRGYGLVDVHNYQVAVEASNLQDAVQAYANALQTGEGIVDQSVKSVKVTGDILRKQADVQAGSTTYYMVVQGAKPILTATTAVSQLVPVLEKGDKVTVTFAQGSGQTAVVQSIQLDGSLH